MQVQEFVQNVQVNLCNCTRCCQDVIEPVTLTGAQRNVDIDNAVQVNLSIARCNPASRLVIESV